MVRVAGYISVLNAGCYVTLWRLPLPRQAPLFFVSVNDRWCRMNWLLRLFFGLLVCGGFAAHAQENAKAPPSPAPPPGVTYSPDIEYGTGAGEKLRLDLAKPEKMERA